MRDVRLHRNWQLAKGDAAPRCRSLSEVRFIHDFNLHACMQHQMKLASAD